MHIANLQSKQKIVAHNSLHNNALDSQKQSYTIYIMHLKETELETPALGHVIGSFSQIYNSKRHINIHRSWPDYYCFHKYPFTVFMLGGGYFLFPVASLSDIPTKGGHRWLMHRQYIPDTSFSILFSSCSTFTATYPLYFLTLKFSDNDTTPLPK